MVCSGCTMAQLDVTRMRFTALWAWLIAHSVVLGDLICPKCKVLSKFVPQHLLFRCCKQRVIRKQGARVKLQCTFRRSALAGTWFGGSKLSVRSIMEFCAAWLWVPYPKQEYLMQNLRLSSHTVTDWSSFCREVCIYWACRNSQQKIGGPGTIVEIDEAKFGKRKYNRGRRVTGRWVFGGIQRGSRTNIFLVDVERRDRDTLLKIIKERILPGTTIMSDRWKAYDTLGAEGFQHFSVNHSVSFVDWDDPSVHTQNVERMWRDARGVVPRFGRKQEHFAGYLAEFMFRRAHRRKTELLHSFFVAAGQLYPPPQTAIQ